MTLPRPLPGLFRLRSFDEVVIAVQEIVRTVNRLNDVAGELIAGGGGGGGGAPTTAQYVVAASDATLTAERILTAVAGETNVDFGTAGQAKVGISPHLAASDPHPQYLTPSEGNAAYSLLGHTHTESQVTNLTTDLAAKEATANKGVASGYAGLDGSSKVPIAQLPTGSTSTTVAIGNDSRLSDARTPTAHHTTHENGGADELSVAGLNGVLADPQPPIIGSTGTTAVAGNDARLTNARTPTAHATTHQPGGTDAMAIDAAAGTGSLRTLGTGANQAAAGNDSRLSNARTPTAHASTHSNGSSDPVTVTSLAGYPGGTSTFLRADGTFAAPGGGADPWSYLVLASDFTTTSASAVDVTGMGFTPSANTRYEFYGFLMLRTATTTVNPRVGLAWPTGGTDGVAMIYESQAATSAPINANGNLNAALLAPAGGLPNTTQSWPVGVEGMFLAGASPSGNVRLQLASETAGTTVTIKAGSFLRYRTF